MSWQMTLSAVALIATSVRAAETAHGFSLEQVLSAPFPADMVAAPTAGRVAWVYNEHGARNVWVADSDHNGRRLTAYSGDNGYDLGEIAWDSQGQHVFYTRGGSLEGGGPVNALSLPSGAAAQMICTVALDGSTREIAPGHGAAVSSRGDLAFISNGQIWGVPPDGGAPFQRLHDRGEASSLAWSPDGGKLAFVSVRKDHSLVGVLDTSANLLAWLSPSFDTDMAPEWSPDGRQVAWVRKPAGGSEDFTSRQTAATPWSIWVGDVANGAGRPIWVAEPGAGSVFHGTLGERQLLWATGNRIVFPWERTSWLHLYAIPDTGGTPTELTTGGAFEVFNVSLGPDRNRIVYSANANDLDRWHLWEVAATGGAPRALTRGPSIEDYPVLTSDGRVAAIGGDARQPMRPLLVQDGALLELAPTAASPDFPAERLIEPRPVIFPAADGLPIHAQLFSPPAEKTGPRPALMFFHGGPTRQMLLGWHPMDAYTNMYGMNEYLANEGYLVLSVNYRGGIGYGLNFREPPNFAADGASEFNDILGGVTFLRSRRDVDPRRIGLWGGSYGGLMTALGLARAPNLFAAGADYAGVHDWRALLPPSVRPEIAQRAYESSAIATVDRWRSPVLIAHADDDRTVPISQSVELVEALREHGVVVEQKVLPNEIHDLLRERSWLTLFRASDDFFAHYLMFASTESGSK